MKAILLIAVLFVTATLQAAPVGWSTNLTEATASAATNNRPLLLYFTASWCGPCKVMARSTLIDSNVVNRLGGFELACIDIDSFPTIAGDYNVQGVPLFVASVGGSEIERRTGYVAAEEFTEWLDRIVVMAGKASEEQRRIDAQFAELSELLKSKRPEALQRGLELLSQWPSHALDRINLKELFRELAEREPAWLVQVLASPRLPIRIEAANALRVALGDSFEVDPWANAETRTAGISVWRERLGMTVNSSVLPQSAK